MASPRSRPARSGSPAREDILTIDADDKVPVSEEVRTKRNWLWAFKHASGIADAYGLASDLAADLVQMAWETELDELDKGRKPPRSLEGKKTARIHDLLDAAEMLGRQARIPTRPNEILDALPGQVHPIDETAESSEFWRIVRAVVKDDELYEVLRLRLVEGVPPRHLTNHFGRTAKGISRMVEEVKRRLRKARLRILNAYEAAGLAA